MTKEEAVELCVQFSDAKLVVAAFADPMKTAQDELKAQLEKVKKSWEESNAELIKNHHESLTKFAEADKAHRAAIVALYKAQADPSVKSNIIPGWGVAVGEDIQVD